MATCGVCDAGNLPVLQPKYPLKIFGKIECEQEFHDCPSQLMAVLEDHSVVSCSNGEKEQ